MSDYYDPSPTLSLERPLVVAGLLVDDNRRVAQRLAAVTGLTYSDLDRLVEHRAGQSLWELLQEEGGEVRYRQLERQELLGFLADRPAGILSLGDATLLDAENRADLRSQATIVALDLDLAGCYWRLRKRRGGSPHPLAPSRVEELEDVRPFFEERRPYLDVAHHRLAWDGRRLAEMTTAIQRLLSDAESASG